MLLTSCGTFDTKEDHPLGKLLKSNAEEMGGRFVEWEKLLKEKGVDQEWTKLPLNIVRLGANLKAESLESLFSGVKVHYQSETHQSNEMQCFICSLHTPA